MVTNNLAIATDKPIRFLDHTNEKFIFNTVNDAMTSFAIDDAIAEAASIDLVPPTVRTWVHEPTVVLGIPDSRLPYIDEGLQFIKENNTKAIIRNSGGLAVFLDPGVLNMSIIIPDNRKMSINDGYDMMLQFIRKLFHPWTNAIKAYEIVGSYCPGDYDLSLKGIKFAGISQRRIRNSIAVQIYIDIEGDSQHRAQVVKDFYSISNRGSTTSYVYPDIVPSTMGSISRLLDVPFTVNRVIDDIKELLISNYRLADETLALEEEQSFFKRLKQMKKRNERLV